MHHGFTLYYQQDLVQALSRLPQGTAGALVALAFMVGRVQVFYL